MRFICGFLYMLHFAACPLELFEQPVHEVGLNLPVALCYLLLSATLVHRLMETAKEMIRESLPIKCLEAAILALYPQHLLSRASREMLTHCKL